MISYYKLSEWVESQECLSPPGALIQAAGTRAARNHSPELKRRKQVFFCFCFFSFGFGVRFLSRFVCLFVFCCVVILGFFHQRFSGWAAHYYKDRESAWFDFCCKETQPCS